MITIYWWPGLRPALRWEKPDSCKRDLLVAIVTCIKSFAMHVLSVDMLLPLVLCSNSKAEFHEFTKQFQYKFTSHHASNALADGARPWILLGRAHNAPPDPLVAFYMPPGNAFRCKQYFSLFFSVTQLSQKELLYGHYTMHNALCQRTLWSSCQRVCSVCSIRVADRVAEPGQRLGRNSVPLNLNLPLQHCLYRITIRTLEKT